MQGKKDDKTYLGSSCKANSNAGSTAFPCLQISPVKLSLLAVLISSIALVGCGGSTTKKSFTIAVAPSSISITPGGSSQTLVVSASPVNGFADTVSVVLSSLPSGVTASPSTLTLTPGALGQIALSASASAKAGSSTITITGTAGAMSQTATSSLTVNAPPSPVTSATLSTYYFDFGDNLVNNSLTKTVVVVTNTGSSSLTMSPALSGDTSYSIVADQSCGSSLAPSASCDMVVNYKPTAASAPKSQDAVLNMGFGDVDASTPQIVAITGSSAALSAGTVTATNNPQVALYTMTLPFPGSMTVNFGTTTNYTLNTWKQSTDSAGGQISIFVAGMMATTTYHMAATIEFANGITVTDTDHTFTTGAVPNSQGLNLSLTTTTTSGLTPQPGLELLNPLAGIVITDLSGNTLWTYANPGITTYNYVQGVKMLDNGDILMAIGPGSNIPLNGPISANAFVEIREVNLAGDTVREISINDLNDRLKTATCAECHVTLQTFHHDITPLPNGHWLVLANALMNLSSSTTPALTNAPAQAVLGDVIVDLDENLRPVWAWNQFNHLDPNRHPMQFPDWTHSNAVVYSPDDGNILVSIRHQHWVIKVDYANGSGTGKVLWRLGQAGDFTLQGGTDPTDWQYAQHAPSFFSQNTSGVFSLGMMDNGDNRLFAKGVSCGTAGAPACNYTTAIAYEIDENAKTATIKFHQIQPDNLYAFWGGNTEQLANGNVEYDLCGLSSESIVNEVTQEANPTTVWSMTVSNTNFYRAFRIPSMYPGVQW